MSLMVEENASGGTEGAVAVEGQHVGLTVGAILEIQKPYGGLRCANYRRAYPVHRKKQAR